MNHLNLPAIHTSPHLPHCFPVSYSTLCAQALTDHLLSQYPIGPIHHCQLWNRGLSDVYLVETEHQQYILRISPAQSRDYEDVLFEMEVLQFLQQQGIPVAAPLASHEGQIVLCIAAPEGDRYAALTTYAPGKIPLGDFNQNQSRILGETLAKLHRASLDFQPTVMRDRLDLDYLVDQSLATIVPQINHVGHVETLRATAASLHEQLQTLPSDAPYWVVCWGDPHSGNVHFTPNQQPTLFDFDQCGYGWRAFDIAKFLQQALCSGMSYSVRDAFVTGYQTIAPLEPVELAALTALTQVAQLWRWSISVGHALIHDTRRLDESYHRTRLEQLKLLQGYDWQAMQVLQQAAKV
jgi:Ser/Thr protein kinase RdoA (MazF antagonist)